MPRRFRAAVALTAGDDSNVHTVALKQFRCLHDRHDSLQRDECALDRHESGLRDDIRKRREDVRATDRPIREDPPADDILVKVDGASMLAWLKVRSPSP